MGNGTELSCPGPVVTWVVHFQDQETLFPIPLVPVHHWHFPLDQDTLEEPPPLGSKWMEMHQRRRNNNREKKRKERRGSDRDKNSAGTCNLKKNVGTGHFRGLVEVHELKTKASETIPPPSSWVHNVLTEQSVQEFTLVLHNPSLIRSLIHSTIPCGMCRVPGLVLRSQRGEHKLKRREM